MADLNHAVNYAKENQRNTLQQLMEFLEIPSISALVENKDDVSRAADWVSSRLEQIGAKKVEIFPTSGHPIVTGSIMERVGAPVVLVYGHYDVQPADPLDEWLSPPFNPSIRGDNLFARGATDMKAQLVAFLAAIEAIRQTGNIPINLIFMIEGEEEVGSPNLVGYLKNVKDKLSCDFCLNLDAGILALELPSIMIGLRGLAYFELWLQGPATDLHSGKFGGAIENPAMVLVELLAGMRDARGRITLPGFYDKVSPLAPEDREEMARLPQDDDWWLKSSGAKALRQDGDWTPTEQATARPTLEINGLLSGFTGEGSKTVLPAKAMAKISMRLVPDQTPADMRGSLEKYLEQNIPGTVSYTLIEMHGAKPAVLDRDFYAVKAAREALKEVWGKEPVFTRDGGTVPVVGLIKEMLGIQSLLLGFGLPDDNPHGPNEKQHLPTLYRGIETYIQFLHNVSRMQSEN
jgi:acetylornithine deacetylase/succinyl-diaminopimelate desuccinylase-like protein